MDVKFELIPTGVKELEEKMTRAQSLLAELKTLISEINNCQVTVTVKPL